MSSTNVGLSLVVLRNIPLFSGLDESELERLSRVALRKRAGRGEQVVLMLVIAAVLVLPRIAAARRRARFGPR